MGVPTSKYGPQISHIFFANDSLLFCRSSMTQWHHLTSFLKKYEEASGHWLNCSKTTIFFNKNTLQVTREEIVAETGILVTQRYDTYLGLLALVGKSKMAAFKKLKDRMWKRLQDWKMKFLSQVGKEILIKAVIQAILTYNMNVFLLPKALCSEMNSLMHKFWCGYQDKAQVHWMSWSHLGTSKE